MFCSYSKQSRNMAHVYQDISDWFWKDTFWLPPNKTWTEFIRNETTFMPLPRDMWAPIPIAVVLFVVRLMWETLVANPIGKAYNFNSVPPRAPVPNEILEKQFRKDRSLPDIKKLQALSKQADLSTRQIERWWRRRRLAGKPSEMQRFKETSWRFLYYFAAFYCGLVILWDKPWLWDNRQCWVEFPQPVPREVYWYYMVELGFYCSLILSLFMDNKRKDFVEMTTHHVATILLMVMSWSTGMVRIGTLVLCIHDAVDYWMEGAKLAKYMKYHTLCDVLFVIFAIVWFITRLVLYPMKVIRSAFLYSWEMVGLWPMHLVLNGFLLLLQVLHIIWFYMIVRMFHSYIVKGQVDKDERSETEPESSSEDEDTVKTSSLDKEYPMTSATHPVHNGIEARKRH